MMQRYETFDHPRPLNIQQPRIRFCCPEVKYFLLFEHKIIILYTSKFQYSYHHCSLTFCYIEIMNLSVWWPYWATKHQMAQSNFTQTTRRQSVYITGRYHNFKIRLQAKVCGTNWISIQNKQWQFINADQLYLMVWHMQC